jgi:hypothetical protein
MLKEIDCDGSHSRKQTSSLLLQSGLQKLSNYNESLMTEIFLPVLRSCAPFSLLHTTII